MGALSHMYAFFEGIHISHTNCSNIILVIVNYFLYYVRNEKKNKKIELNWIDNFLHDAYFT